MRGVFPIAGCDQSQGFNWGGDQDVPSVNPLVYPCALETLRPYAFTLSADANASLAAARYAVVANRLAPVRNIYISFCVAERTDEKWQ